MTSEGLGEMFEGDSADTCAGKFPLVLMEGRAEGLACTDLGSRTPIGASGNFKELRFQILLSQTLDPGHYLSFRISAKVVCNCFCLVRFSLRL